MQKVWPVHSRLSCDVSLSVPSELLVEDQSLEGSSASTAPIIASISSMPFDLLCSRSSLGAENKSCSVLESVLGMYESKLSSDSNLPSEWEHNLVESSVSTPLSSALNFF